MGIKLGLFARDSKKRDRDCLLRMSSKHLSFSNPSEKKENSFIPSPICPSFSWCMDVCFPSKVPSMLSHCCPFRYGPTVLFRPFLMNRWFHDSGCSLSSMFSSVKAPNYTYTMHSAGKQPGHETAFGSICVPLWHEISALLSWFHCSSRSLECY